MEKIKIEVKKYKVLTKEESLEFFSSDADRLKDIENGMVGVLFTEFGDIVQSQVIVPGTNPANIDVWNTDHMHDCKDIIDLKCLYIIHTNEILEEDCPMPVLEVYNELEYDNFVKKTTYEDWKQLDSTRICSIEEFENNVLNFCQANEDVYKIYEYFQPSKPLSRKLLGNIAKYSEPRYYMKNIDFIRKLNAFSEGEGNLKVLTYNIPTFIQNNDWMEKFYQTVIDIDGNRMPFLLLVDIVFGGNYIKSWEDKKSLSRLGKIYLNFKQCEERR